ncbi:MAG: YitT family protein [Thermodesulfobacteriota bacterium]
MRDITYSVPWNLMLITMGSALVGYAIKAVLVPHGFVSGGISGLGVLLSYVAGGLTPGWWYLLLNIPILLVGWFSVSRRFFFYTVFGIAAVSAAIELIPWTAPIHDKFLAVLAGGTLFGAGAGTALRSLGSTGGVDVLAVFLNNKFNIRVGQVSFTFNLLLLLTSMHFLDVERALYSLAMLFVSAMVMDYFLSLFNQRKMVLVISDYPEEIAEAILHRIHRGVTYLSGQGAYTGKPKKIILTVVNNIQLKRLEEAIFTIDPQAFTIVGNTFNVLGRRFSRRKVY